MIIQSERTSVSSTQKVETCDQCNGAGLTPSPLGEMRVTLCDGCNGHGKVIVSEWLESNLGEVIRRVSYA